MNEFILSTLESCLSKDVKRFNAETGDVKAYGPSFEDLGDYLPALIMFGRDDLWRSEVDRVVEFLRENDYIYRDEGRGVLKQFTRCYSQTDLLWGLLLAAKFDASYVDKLQQPLEAVYNNFLKGNLNFLLLTHIPFLKKRLPKFLRKKIHIASSEDHGMYIEVFVLAYQLTNEYKYLDVARELAGKLYSSAFFVENKFLPFYDPKTSLSKLLVSVMPQFRKRDKEFQLLKQNSNALFGLYALGKFDPLYMEVFKSTLSAWMDSFYNAEDKIFYTNFNLTNGDKGSDLTVFHLIELLILAGDLQRAMEIADGIIEGQSKESGLVPFFHPKSPQKLRRMNAELTSSWLDSAVDFGVALVKLYQLVNEARYLDSAKRILSGIDALHRKEFGFCAEVNFENGKVINPLYSTKMTGLVCKLSLAIEYMSEINEEGSKYNLLLQDR